MYKMARLAVGAVLALACASIASADQWNDRTEMTFSEPVLIPGAILQPGTYVFELADTTASRHIVQVFAKDRTLVTTTQAVPTKRMDPKGDVVVRFNPTEAGTPPALKAWFYPGSLYGHEFIYPDDQARTIAERSKTLVLSTDVPGSDMSKGTLQTYDASGMRAPWKGDAATMGEWEAWRQSRERTGPSAAVRSSDQRESRAPMVKGDFQGMRVKIDDLEDNPSQYTGKTISVDAEVEEVFGPRLFTIDEPSWGDLAGEVLVYMDTDLAALVKEDDRVTITGRMQPLSLVEVEREWGWLGLDPHIEVKVKDKPVLIAQRIVGGDDNVAMVIKAGSAGERAVGTAGAATTAITDAAAIRGEDQIGRHVELKQIQVAAPAEKHGFFVRSGNQHLFVLPANASEPAVRAGDSLTIHGVVLQMPDKMDGRLKAPGALNDDVYVYAINITR